MTHPDWRTRHHGTTTTQIYIGQGEPRVPEKCKSAGSEEEAIDAALNAMADTRTDGPFFRVSLDDLDATQEAKPVAWGESYDGGRFFNTVSLTKTRHHTFPLYTHPAPAPAVPVEALIEELLDAQQDINLAANTYMDQSLCDASALIDRVEAALRAQPAPQVKALVCAAQALVDRWDSPLWGGSAVNLRHTGEYIASLRSALSALSGEAQR